MDEVIIIRMEGNILSQTRDAINKKLEAGLVLTEAKVDGYWLQLIFKSSEFKENPDPLGETTI